MTTAAEKFDLVPPWCRLGNTCIEAMPLQHPGVWAKADGTWGDSSVPDIDSKDVRRIARLTSPLDSWEPAEDCPLPVDGWKVRRCATGPGWFVAAIGDNSIFSVSGAVNKRFDTRRAAIVWAWKEGPAPACKESLHVAGRITPEADAQTDGKGRTLVEIDAALEDVFGEVASYARRVENLERLISAQVAKPATLNTRSDDASTNEVMTEAAASDDGWREMLVPVSYPNGASVWWRTPDGKYESRQADNADAGWYTGATPSMVPVSGTVDAEYLAVLDRLAPPPNLHEWYKPKAAAFRDTAAANADTLKDYDAACAAVPSTYRVGDDLAAWVRTLASAHEQALQYQRELERKLSDEKAEFDRLADDRNNLVSKLAAINDVLPHDMPVFSSHKDAVQHIVNRMRKAESELAAANESARQAEGRAHTAMKRACKAEEELSDLRGKVENLRAAFSG